MTDLTTPLPAVAEAAASVAPVTDTVTSTLSAGDTAWMLTSTMLVGSTEHHS